MATKRPDTDTGSEFSVGPIKARGEAAKMVARHAPTILLVVILTGGIPAIWSGTSNLSAIRSEDLAEIRADLAEIKQAQAAHVAESRLALARLPSAVDLRSDHDEIVRLRATVASCCGTQEVDRARRGARLDRLRVAVDPTDEAAADEAAAADLDAGVSTNVRDTSADADTTPVPADPRGIAGR